MPTGLSLDTAHTALLAMDCQAGIVSVYVKPAGEFLDKASGCVRAARAAGMPVIHIRVGFRPKLPEVSSRNKLFGAILASPEHQNLFEGPSGDVHPALGPAPDDIVITKHRVSAFTGTDLDMILRAKNIDTLVLFGIATSGVVLSTLLEASDADYRIVVISDCCADNDPVLHEALLTRLYTRRADVITADAFVLAVQPHANP